MPAYPWQRKGWTLAETFMMGQRLKSMQMDMDEKQRQIDLIPKRAEAMKAYQGGDPSQLQLMDPELYGRLEDRRIQGERRAQEGVDRNQALEAKKLQMLARTVPAVQRNPAAYQGARAHLLQSGLFKPEEIPDEYNKEQVDQLASVLPQMAGTAPPQQQAPTLRDAVEKRAFVNFRAENPGASPKIAFEDSSWPQHIETAKSELLTRAKAGATRLDVHTGPGRQEPTKSVKSKLHNIIVDNALLGPQIARIKSRAKPEMFMAFPQLKMFTSKYAAWFNPKLLSKDTTKAFGAKTKLLADVGKGMLVFRKWATGVAGGEKEMDRIEALMPRKEDVWPEFVAKLELWGEEVNTKVRLAQRILSSGIPIDDPQFENDMFMAIAEGDEGRSREDIERRLVTLDKKHKGDRKKTVEIMIGEGYFNEDTEDQARALLRMGP